MFDDHLNASRSLVEARRIASEATSMSCPPSIKELSRMFDVRLHDSLECSRSIYTSLGVWFKHAVLKRGNNREVPLVDSRSVWNDG